MSTAPVSKPRVRSAQRLARMADATAARVRGGWLGGWKAALSVGTLALAAGGALAGPEGAQVVRGNVSISRNGSETLITAGRNSIINYRSFDIGANESVRFIQPDAAARVLNRINSAAPTRIDGGLSANGRVYIVNPAGVVFGSGSIVNVNSLFAAAGHLSDSDFLNGNDRFKLTGSVANQGQINASFVSLLGSHVSNMGTIVAPRGAVVLAAGSDVYLGEHGGNIYVKVEGAATAPEGHAAAENSGAIDARGGRAIIGAGDMYALAIRSSGTIKAKSVSLQGQGSGAVEVGGTIQARAEQPHAARSRAAQPAATTIGGTVDVTGERIALRGANIDASGEAGGGAVRIGGGFQGRGDLRQAERTYISADSVINADATQRGNAGGVVVWSTQATNFEGTISAKGGPLAGDAGHIEVSSKDTLRFNGWVDATAANGKAGSVLLDPRDITIANAGADDLATNDEFLENPSTDVTFDADLLTAILDAGTPLTLQANRDLTVNEAIIVNNAGGDGGALTFQAGRSIAINANITTDNGSLGLFANDSGASSADRGAGNGGISIANGVTLDIGGGGFTATIRPAAGGGFDPGDIVFGDSTTLFAGAVSMNTPGAITIGTGTTTLNVADYLAAAGGAISLAHAVTAPGTVVLQAGSDITISDDISAAGMNLWAAQGGTGTLAFGAAGVDLSGDTIILRAGDSAGGNATTASVDAVTNAPAFHAAAGGATSPASFFIRQDADFADAIIPAAAQFAGGVAGMSYTLRSDDGSLTIATASKVAGSALLATGAAGVTIDTDLTLDSLNVAGDATLNANIDAGGGFVIFNNALDLGAADRGIIGGAMLFAGPVTSSGGGIDLANSGLLTLSGEVDLTGGAFTQSGSGAVVLANAIHTEGQAIQFNGAITLGAAAPQSTVVIDTTSGGDVAAGGLIRFASTIDAENEGGQALALYAGGGNILLSGVVGGSSRLSVLAIQSVANYSSLAVHAGDAVQVSGAGTTQFNGVIDATRNIDLAGNAVELNLGAIAQGSVSINNSGLLTVGDTLFGSAGVAQTGAGPVLLAANVTSEGGAIAFSGPITLAADVLLDSTNAGSNASGGGVTLSGPVDADDAANDRVLTIHAGTAGVAALNGGVGATQALASIDVSGQSIFLAGVRTKASQTYAGTTTLSGNLRSLVGGGITFNGTTLLNADVLIETAGLSGSDDVLFNGFVDAVAQAPASGLTVTAGSGDLIFQRSVGSVRPIDSLTASANTIRLQSVLTTGAQSYTGALRLQGGAYSGTDLAFTGPVELAADATVTGTSSVSFNGTIDSTFADQRALTVLSPNTLFAASVGAANGGELGSLATDAGGLTIGGGLIRAAGPINIGDAVTLNASVAVVSLDAGVSFLGAINSDSTLRSLSISTANNNDTVFGSTIGFTNALRSLTTSDDGRTLLGGDIVTFEFQRYRNAVVLSADASLIGNSISFFSTIDSDGSTSGRSLSVSGGSGGITVTGAIGGSEQLGGLTMTGDQITLASATTQGFQTFNGITSTFGDLRSTQSGAITINGDFRPRAADATLRTAGLAATDDITITGAVNNRLGSHRIALNAGAGDVSIAGAVGTQPLANDFVPSQLTITGNTIALNAVRTTGAQLYSGATTLFGDLVTTGGGAVAISGATRLGANITVTTADGPIVFGGVLDSDATNRSLIVLTGGAGQTRFVGAVGATSPLLSLFTNSDGATRIEGGSIRAINDIQFDDAVILANTTTLAGNDIVFSSTLNSDGLGTPRALTLNSTTSGGDTGETTFAGIVGGIAPLRSLTTNADGNTFLAANVTTTQGVDFGDAILLLDTVAVDGGRGFLIFRSTIDADPSQTDPGLTLLSLAASDAHQSVSPAFRFGGNIGNTRQLGSLTLGADLPDPQWAATAVFTDSFDSAGRILRSGVAGTDQFTIKTGSGGFTMGRNQKLTAFGSLTLTSTGTVRLGDLTALTNITVTSPDIRIRRRPAGDVQDNVFESPDQRVRDVGVDFVASGTIDFSSVPTLEGSGGTPTFSNNSGAADAQLNGFAFRRYPGGILTDLFADPGNNNMLLALDLRSLGPTLTNLSTSLAQALPNADNPSVFEGVQPTAAEAAQLAELGIAVRTMSFERIMDALAGRAVYGDLPLRSRPSVEAGDFAVSPPRLSMPAVRAVIASYRDLVLVPVLDDQGRQAFNDDGTPKATDRTPFIKQTLTAAWERYTKTANQPTGQGFREHLEGLGASASPEDAQALGFLNSTRRVFNRLDDLGLSEYETSIPKRRLTSDIKPAAMTDAEFRAAVYGEAASMALLR